jgi:RNA polymerase sigma factor (sigma-70 family)
MTGVRAPFGATTRDLVTLVQENGAAARDALDALIESNETMMRAATACVDGTAADFDVYVQDARLAFVRAVYAWAPERGASLAVYAYGRMVRAVRRAVVRSQRSRRRVCPLVWERRPGDGGVPEPADPDPLIAERLDERLAVRNAVRRLPLRDRALLFGLYWRDQTQAGVARSLGVSQQYVSKRHLQILARLNTLYTSTTRPQRSQKA